MKDVITLRSLESKNGAIPRSETWHFTWWNDKIDLDRVQ
jgi:hypothetical protein